MTTLHLMNPQPARSAAADAAAALGAIPASNGVERRVHRRHDLDAQAISVERWDGARRASKAFGTIVDLSAGGVRIRINGRLMHRNDAGISPFVDTTDGLKPKREWVGWMAVTRVKPAEGNALDVAGRLIDMDEIDRGMLGLYLSTQPLAA